MLKRTGQDPFDADKTKMEWRVGRSYILKAFEQHSKTCPRVESPRNTLNRKHKGRRGLAVLSFLFAAANLSFSANCSVYSEFLAI